MSANFQKTFSITCILLKNQRLQRANTVDPDETAHYEPSHLDLQCLQIQLLLCLVLYGLKSYDACLHWNLLASLTGLFCCIQSLDAVFSNDHHFRLFCIIHDFVI